MPRYFRLQLAIIASETHIGAGKFYLELRVRVRHQKPLCASARAQALVPSWQLLKAAELLLAVPLAGRAERAPKENKTKQSKARHNKGK